MRRTPVSGSCSLKPCWIRRCFRWLWAESSDIRPKTGNRGSYVGNKFVPRSCLYAGRSSPVNLSLLGSAGGRIRECYYYASLRWHLYAAALVTDLSGNFRGVKVFALITSGNAASIILSA